MNESEIDSILANKVRRSVGATQLPSGMEERLVGSIRRARRVFRAKVMAVLALLSVGCILAVGLSGRSERVSGLGETSLIAAQDAANGDRDSVSGWMLLGFFRECFRVNRRKERD